VMGRALLSLVLSPPTSRPPASALLTAMLRQAGLPHWSAWYVCRADVANDQWGKSHFNWQV